MNTHYFLNTSDYSFEPFFDRGFSGQILLASPKSNALPKLLIKHENPCSACNEFMYSRLAELIHIPVPKAFIMNVQKRDASLFRSPYVVGIEYYDNLQPFTLEEMNRLPNGRKEYAGQYALAVMFEQEDSVQLSKTPDGHIIGLDFTEAFCLSDMTLLNQKVSDDVLTDIVANRLRGYMAKNFVLWANAGLDVLKKHFDDPNGNFTSYFFEPMKAMCRITDEQIQELSDVLYEIYPVSIVVYFEEYLEILKKKIAAYITKIESAVLNGETK